VLWLVVLIDLIGFGLTTVPFPIVMQEMGASPFWITFAGPGVYSALQLVFTPIWGRLSDTYGRRPILMVSMAGAVVSYVILATASSWWLLIIARALAGIASGNISAAYAYVSDVSDPKNRAKSLGILSSAFGLGFMLGPPIGAFLAEIGGGPVSLRWPALVALVLAALALLGTWLVLPESLTPDARRAATNPGAPRQSPFALLSNRPVLLGIVTTALLVSVAGALMQSVYPIWVQAVHGHSPKWAGYAFMLLAALAVAAQAGLVGVLAKRLGERGVAISGVIGFGTGLAILAALHQPVMLWVGLIVMGLGLGLATPSLSALASFQAAPHERGSVMAAFQSGTSLGRAIGPALSGPVYAAIGYGAPFWLAAVLAAPALFFTLRIPEPTQGARASRTA
jgi:multidrug resistance protein